MMNDVIAISKDRYQLVKIALINHQIYNLIATDQLLAIIKDHQS